ncbi:DUF2971 domain-containing protein [Moritella viscosa]
MLINRYGWENLFFLNDEKEYQLGIDLFNTCLEEQKIKYGSSQFGVFLSSLNNIEKLLKESPPFSFSLTEEGDLLSQWRGYTKNGIGVNVGFSSLGLKDSFQLLPCLYTLEEQRKYIEHLFDLAINKFSHTEEKGQFDKALCLNPSELPHWDAINEAGTQLISHLSAACSIIKDTSFSEEKEWRLVCFTRDNIEFVPKDTYLKPIKKMNIEPDKIVTSIKVGPNPNKNLCRSSINALLKANGLKDTQVSISEIPYRNKT